MARELPPRPPKEGLGLRRLGHDLVYRRERFRQLLGILFIVVLTLLGRPAHRELLLGGIVLVALGEAIRLWASGHIKKDQSLATDGPYGFVRHPLYVGNFLLSVGFLMAAELLWAVPVMAVFWLLFYPPAIRSEDAKLHHLFGESWERWRARTRALLPRLTPYGGRIGGSWSLRQSLRINGEPLIAIFLAVCLAVLYRRLGG